MERIEDSFSFLIAKAYQQVQIAARRRLEPFKITTVQYSLLNVLWEQDGQSGAELGARLKLDGATVTGMLDRLEHSKFIERKPDPKDRRINRVYLTLPGLALQEPAQHAIISLNNEILSQFNPADTIRLRQMLGELAQEAETLA